MIEDLPSLKSATIERCASRAREGYARASNTLTFDRTVRDAATLNFLRHIQTRPDTGRHLIHCGRLGAPQSTRNLLMIVPTLQRAYASRSLQRLDAERPTLRPPRWSAGPSQRPCLYAYCVEKQQYRLSKKKKSRDYRPDDEIKSNPMIYRSFFKTRKVANPGSSRNPQYAISQNSV